MAVDDVNGTPAAMGPRLRAARERHGATLAGVGRATGISPSTLSRIETGRRKPTLEVVLQLSKEYGVSMDELAGTAPAPATEPRAAAPLRFGDGKAVLPLTRYVGGLHAHKHVLPAVEDAPARPGQVSHDGYEWLCVLYGRLWLALGSQDLVLAAGDVAEFDTRIPHGVANAAPGGPVEYLIMFGPQGERLRLRTPPAAGRGNRRPNPAQVNREEQPWDPAPVPTDASPT
ncbi:transcriptional regulator [Streptomyces toyocaensis]|uniref:Transcriptional regulator n=1 Tax=Streptomyces toyocaensis TaxID=55952 RepID=A0A081XY27_STRTO|nr:helix-turn-helix transcriptional regulator [Streptomyces toyocaensis]KES08450.1 transcriptional regulator [Streptomyces toyocaensis]